jgi:thioredoxin-related protein
MYKPSIFKQIAILFITLLYCQLSMAQTGITFSETGLKTALARGKAENKPVMLWCYTSWCPHCKKMEETVFPNSQVADYFNKTFVCVAQDLEKGEGLEMKKELKIASFPTFILYNPSGEIVYRVEGELKQDAFITEGKTALIPKKQFPFLKQQFENDVSNSANCLEYIRALRKGGIDVSDITNRYFDTQSDNQLLSELNWQIFTNGVTDFTSRMFRFVIKHQKEFAGIASPARVKRKLDFEVKALLNPLVETIDTVNYPIKRQLATQVHSFSTDSLIYYFDLKLYDFTRNWKMYVETCTLSADKFSWNNHYQLNDLATNILTNCNDSRAWLMAERLANRAAELDVSYDNYMLCARLYKKLNNKTEAIKSAKKAYELAKKFGWEGVEAKQLLKELNNPII